ncbi:MAG: hypothetical protein A2063_04300 [Gallionellales bacterium GWA2_60_142]|nr:MAG: hypothetical protein A2063_04300 [Gallionellales bacterium GWA2_60_142]
MVFSTASTRDLTLEVAIEILVWPNGFEIYQAHFFLDGIAKQIELSLAAKFVNVQISQIAFLAFANGGLFTNLRDGKIYVSRDVVMQFLVLAGKPPCLLNAVAHA